MKLLIGEQTFKAQNQFLGGFDDVIADVSLPVCVNRKTFEPYEAGSHGLLSELLRMLPSLSTGSRHAGWHWDRVAWVGTNMLQAKTQTKEVHAQLIRGVPLQLARVRSAVLT